MKIITPIEKNLSKEKYMINIQNYNNYTHAQVLIGLENAASYFAMRLRKNGIAFNGFYRYTVRAENGEVIKRRFPLPDDSIISVTYITASNGFEATVYAREYKSLLAYIHKPIAILQMIAELEYAKQLLNEEVEKRISFENVLIPWYFADEKDLLYKPVNKPFENFNRR